MGSIREHIKKTGERSYHAEVRLKGHPPQRASFRTRTQAKKWVQDTESAIRDGRYTCTAASRRYTVHELIERFITQHLSKEPKYKKQKELLLQRWKTEIGNLYISEITPSLLADIRDRLLSEKTPKGTIRTPSTVNRYLAAFSKVLSFAIKELGWLQENPMQKITKPKESKGRDRFLSQVEVERLLSTCKESSNKNLYHIVSIAILTAMRYGEIISLKWRDVDFEHRFITIQETKNGSKRIIPITNKLNQILKSCLSYGNELNSFIFPSGKTHKEDNYFSIRKSFANALKKANIHDFKFHDLRHTAASHLAMKGASQGELMEILGHRTPTMTRRYAHYSQKHIANVMEKTSTLIETNQEKE